MGLLLAASLSAALLAGLAPVADAAPANVPAARVGTFRTAPTPTISGSLKVGATLTAKPGVWKPAATLRYQWFRGSSTIGGATRPTYALGAADRGWTIKVRVTGAAKGYATASKTSAATRKVAYGTFIAAPVPTIKGKPRVGLIVTADPGIWKPSAKLSYQWNLANSRVSGATGKSWTLPASAARKTVTVTVRAVMPGYSTMSRTSTGLVVQPGVLAGSTPTVAGRATVRQTLTANPGSWTVGTRLSYAWFRNGDRIDGATGRTFVVGWPDEGTAISVRVTGTKAGYTSKSVNSSPVTIGAPSDLRNGETITRGQWLRSPNGAYSLIMQGDGNLVEYGPSGAVWSSGTTGSGADRAVLQGDGNLVVYAPSGAKWASGTDGYGPAVTLNLQDDANMVLYRNGSAVWTRAVVRWLAVGARAMSGGTPGTQSMSGPTLNSTQYGIYAPGTKVAVVCGTTSGQGVSGAFSPAKDYTWHRLLGGDWVPDADFYTGTNGLFSGEPDCTPPGGGNGASKLDAYVAAHPAGSQVGDGQCVALVKDYLRWVWGENPGALGNGVDYRAGGIGGNFLASNGWTWSTDQNFARGDILVWGSGAYTSGYGHVAIWYNANGHQLYEQNGVGANALRVFYGNFFSSGYLGHWHHN